MGGRRSVARRLSGAVVAGGCNSTGNSIPDGLVSGDCAKIEQAQTKLQKVSPLVF
jgi:hypothetical protein